MSLSIMLQSYSLLQTFTDHSHKGCIKCVAISDNKILVSGCTDESIHIYNLRTRKEHGTLEEHEGLSFLKITVVYQSKTECY